MRPDSYSVGDVVAYVNQDLNGNTVLHRIVERKGDSYVLQGDNNDFVDPYEPRTDEIVGKMWVRIPAGGRVLNAIRVPRNALLLSLGLVLMAVGGIGSRKRKGRRSLKPERARDARPPARARYLGGGRPAIAAASLACLVIFGALGAAAFIQPLRHEVPVTVSYRQLGDFHYSADVPQGPVYEKELTTGDPVFLRVVDSIDVGFDYRFESAADPLLEGAAGLVAIVRNSNGWERTFELGPARPFEGTETSVTGRLDLARLRATIEEVERITDVSTESYQLDLEPRIEVEGTIDGAPLEDTFAPVLSLLLDDRQLQLPAEPATGEETSTEALHPGLQSSVPIVRTDDNTIRLGSIRADVSILRVGAVVGAGLCLLVLLLTGIPMLALRRRDEASRINARYGPLLVPMRSVTGSGAVLAEVTDIDALVRVAERYDRPVLHEKRNGAHRYMVEGDGMIYVYSGRAERSA